MQSIPSTFEPRYLSRFVPFVAGAIDWTEPPEAKADASDSQARRLWTERFAARTFELRPDADLRLVTAMVNELWAMVGHFNPEIAAEMEYEVWRCTH